MAATEPVWSISEVNAAVRDLIESSLTPFWLHGEVGTLNVYRSGHVYLTLKDRECQLRGTFFNGAATAAQLGLAVGTQVEAYGKLTVYAQRGDYQFNIKSLRIAGQGDLQRQFELLKQKLAAEGLFDAARKRPLPVLPGCIGVVTSADGAAVRDFLQILNRRFPNLPVKIYPATVQGAEAAASVIRGIEFFNRDDTVALIVVTRGGGSMEDLWPFNSEALARAIAASRLPVISAVGHEIDFTIADFVADLRAPTPSAAAELAVTAKSDFLQQLAQLAERGRKALSHAVERRESRLKMAENSYVFREPGHLLESYQQRVDELAKDLGEAVRQAGQVRRNRLELLAGKLVALDPGAVLKRGYAILTPENSGSVLDRVDKLAAGMPVRARLADGDAHLIVR